MKVLEIGRVYRKDEPTVTLEFNLEDLYWLQSLIPHRDGCWEELQKGIDFLEHLKGD